MCSGHDHSDDDHAYPHDSQGVNTTYSDQASPNGERDELSLNRRTFFKRAGLMGGTAAAMSVFGPLSQQAAAADRLASDRPPIDPDDAEATERADKRDPGGSKLRWLSGDHHIHTQYSPDGQYQIMQQIGRAHV